MGIPISINSRRQEVFQYLKDHPKILKMSMRASNAMIYNAFPTEKKANLRGYKREYLQIFEEEIKKSVISQTITSSITNATKPIIPKIPKNITFPEFVKKYAYPRYGSLFKVQKEIYIVIENNKFSYVTIPRDHGKSIDFGFISQYFMKVLGWDVLYLGWTDRRKDIAEYVYNFFLMRNEVQGAKVKTSSSYHFRTNDGGRFDTYLITSKDVLGKHGDYMLSKKRGRPLLMIIDDPIDETFREERHKETKLERKWRSTLSNINAEKIIFSGTRKFEEDFFYFIDLTYKNQLAKYIRSTHLKSGQARYNNDLINNPHNLLCPERWTEDMLIAKRAEIGEYDWFAEYEQEPHPITGEVWTKVGYRLAPKFWTEYKVAEINVDSATTTKKGSSYTGITVVLKEKDAYNFLVINDLTGMYEFEEKLAIIERLYNHLRNVYYHANVIIVIEKQGGGDDLYSSAMSRDFAFASHAHLIHSTREKLSRIRDYLEVPIRSERVKFLENLRTSELIKEILNFPYSAKLDAIDSLATGIAFMEQLPKPRKAADLKALSMKLKHRIWQKELQSQVLPQNPLEKLQKKYYPREVY